MGSLLPGGFYPGNIVWGHTLETFFWLPPLVGVVLVHLMGRSQGFCSTTDDALGQPPAQ